MSQVRHKTRFNCNELKENDWDGRGYHFNSNVQYTAALNLLSRHEFSGDEAVLDVGCGDGKISAYLANSIRNGYVLGVDQSTSMIDFAKSHYKNIKHPNLDFICKDANLLENVPIFDIVFSSFCIQWIMDIESFFARVITYLKPGGKLLAVIPSGISIELDRSFASSMQDPRWLPYFRDFEKTWKLRDAKVFTDVLLGLRFNISFCRDILHTYYFPDASKLKDYVNFSFPYPSYIPPNFRREYVNVIVDDYISKISLDSTHRIPFTFPIVEINAEKTIL